MRLAATAAAAASLSYKDGEDATSPTRRCADQISALRSAGLSVALSIASRTSQARISSARSSTLPRKYRIRKFCTTNQRFGEAESARLSDFLGRAGIRLQALERLGPKFAWTHKETKHAQKIATGRGSCVPDAKVHERSTCVIHLTWFDGQAQPAFLTEIDPSRSNRQAGR